MTKTKWYTKLIYTVVAVALVLSFGLVAAPASPAQAVSSTTWYVDPSGTDDVSHGTGTGTAAFKTINYAIGSASASDTISVAAGTYSNALTGEVFPINVNKEGLTIVSSGTAATTFITPTSADYAAFNVTAAGATIGGSGFTITAGGRGGIYADVTGGSGISVQNCIFKSYSDGESRGMWFENLWNGSLITGNSFATPRLGTGIQVVNADGATISNNIVAAGTLRYCFLTFKAEAFYPDRNLATPYAEYVAENPSTIDDVLVTGNSVTGHATNGPQQGIRFAASTKSCDSGCPQAQDLTVGAGGVSITGGNTFTTNSQVGVLIDADKTKTCGSCTPTDATAHITGVANILINNNDFSGNTKAVENGQTDEGNVNAESNWWNAASGPSTVGLGSGDKVSTYVNFTPWLCKSYATGGTDITVAMNKDYYKTGIWPVVTVNDCSKSGTVGVFAWSSTVGYVGKITIALSETGAGTGIFTGTFKLVNTTPGTSELLVNNGDTVTVQYTNGNTIDDTAIIDNTAPTIAVVSPTAGSKTTNTKPTIEASYADASSGIDTTTVVMKLDGAPVTPLTKTTAHVVYTPGTAIGQGNHTVTVDVSDVAGNAATQKSWSFTVDNVVPVITNPLATPAVVKPAASGGVTPIVFTATVTDPTPGSGIDPATVLLTLTSLNPSHGTLVMVDNGVAPDAAVDGIYTASITNDLITETTYLNLYVNAKDLTGNSATQKAIQQLIVSSDTTPPVIHPSPAITYPFALASARSGDTVTISATVTDDVGVTSVVATCVGFTGAVSMLDNGVAPDVTLGDTIFTGTATVASVTSTITITAKDAKTNTATDTSLSLVVDPDITGVVINLSPGWNFISLPLIPGVPENTDIASVLSGVVNIANVTRVDYYYNTGTSTGWQTYVPGAGGTLETMEDGKGYWIWMSAADTLTVKGRIMPAAPAVPHTYPVYAGWNAIGFKSLGAKTTNAYLSGLTYTVLWEYNTATGYALIYPPAGEDMNVGHGYWLWLATASGTIVPP